MRSLLLLSFIFAFCTQKAVASTVYQTLGAGELLKIEGIKTVKFTRSGRLAVADLNLQYKKGKELKNYSVAVHLAAVDKYRTPNEAEPGKTLTLEQQPELTILESGNVELKIDREADGTVKKVKAILRYKLSDPQGVFHELKFESEDIKDLYISIYSKTSSGPNDKLGESLTKRALQRLFLEHLKWETLQAAAKEKQLAFSTGASASSVIVPASTQTESPVRSHEKVLFQVPRLSKPAEVLKQ